MRDYRMSEVLLQYIWKHRYYNHRELRTEDGDPVFVHNPGDANFNQGPDFNNARITVGDRTMVGPVELHVKTSDFNRHGHKGDPHYSEIILHVVWINNVSEPPAGIPVLALIGRIPGNFAPRERYLAGPPFVPCAALLTGSPGFFNWASLRDRLLHQRLANREQLIRTLLDENNPEWDEVLFQLIARSLGQPVNSDAFLTIARGLRLKDLLRLRTDPARVEGLLLDQAARLGRPLLVHRMRPAHSPYVRLRQLAALLANHSGRFTLLLESDHPAPLLKTLLATGLGPAMRHSILINAFVPLLYTYSILRQEPSQRNKTILWLNIIPPENNRVVRGWHALGLAARSAADTQALLELRKSLCLEKKCLECTIGRSLLALPELQNVALQGMSLLPLTPSPAS